MPNEVTVKDTISNDRPVSFTVKTTAFQVTELRAWMNTYASGDCPKLVWDILDGLRAGMRRQ